MCCLTEPLALALVLFLSVLGSVGRDMRRYDECNSSPPPCSVQEQYQLYTAAKGVIDEAVSLINCNMEAAVIYRGTR